MSDLTRYVLGIVLLCCFVFYSAANPQTTTNRNVQRGSISGRVTFEGNGVPGVVVSLRNREYTPGPNLLPKATTDQDGNYRITRVPAGQYLVRPIAPVFVFADNGAFNQQGRPLVMVEGEEVAGFDFALVRGGVITGKVSDAEGRPLIEERIRLISSGHGDQRLIFYSTNAQTDDRGIYRMFGVPAGAYRVAVGEAEATSSVSPGTYGRRPLKQTFHPDTSEESKGAVIEVKEGEEISNVDITVGPVIPGFTATGRIVDGQTGRPIAGARYRFGRVVDGRPRGFISPATITNSDGEFRIEGLVNGSYQVSMSSQPNQSSFSDEVQFEVRDQDVTGLIVKTSEGASLSGVVVLEGVEDKAIRARLQQMRLVFYVTGEGITLPIGNTATLNSDGSFNVTGLRAGTVRVNLFGSPPGSAAGFSIPRIERDGLPQSRGMAIKAGEHVAGLRIVVEYGTGILRGIVRFENGTLPPGGRLMVLLMRTGERSPVTQRPPQVDSRGHFATEGLPAGTYELEVRAFVPGWGGRRQLRTMQQVIITDGSVTEVVLTLDLDPALGPTP